MSPLPYPSLQLMGFNVVACVFMRVHTHEHTSACTRACSCVCACVCVEGLQESEVGQRMIELFCGVSSCFFLGGERETQH